MQYMANSAPRLFDFLGAKSREHFAGVCERLADAGISYRLNPRLVRGLDYYNLTVFEWVTDRLGAQGTVCGGGRYDGLIELLGGKPAPAVGFAIGMERLLDLCEQTGGQARAAGVRRLSGSPGAIAAQRRAALWWAEACAMPDCVSLFMAVRAGFKAQFKRADAKRCARGVILGDNVCCQRHASQVAARADGQSGHSNNHPLDCLVQS